MKRTRAMVVPVLAVVLLSTAVFSMAASRAGGNSCGINNVVAELPYETVDAVELANLVYMHEEEKLARDVYQAMDDLWGMRVFSNIAMAEQTHMDAVQALKDKYDIQVNISKKAGVFDNEELQALYNQLIAQGTESINSALLVGATIEDVDIFDLLNDLEETDNLDIQTVFQNLMKGSRNHLRAFNSLLVANGVTYAPQFISQDLFDSIIASSKEQGMVDAFGDPVTTEPCGDRRSGRSQRGPGSRR